MRRSDWTAKPRGVVRVAESQLGEVGEIAYGRLLKALTGKRQVVWALVDVLPFSRHCFVWLRARQTLDATIEGLEAADGSSLASLGASSSTIFQPRSPDPTHSSHVPRAAFSNTARHVASCSIRRGCTTPKDKPHVERTIRYVRERFWKGLLQRSRDASAKLTPGAFRSLAGAAMAALVTCRWSSSRNASVRSYCPSANERYDVPVWRTVTVHPEHHISFQGALHSAPSTTCPPGKVLEVRGDRALIKLYRRGELIKSHFRQAQKRRATDPSHHPPHQTAYALRAPDRLVRQAATLGPNVHTFAVRLLEGPLPLAKLRQVQKLLRLGERYTADRLEAACARSLAYELVDVRRLERIIVLAVENDPALDEPLSAAQVLPSRFARPSSAFDHRFS